MRRPFVAARLGMVCRLSRAYSRLGGICELSSHAPADALCSWGRGPFVVNVQLSARDSRQNEGPAWRRGSARKKEATSDGDCRSHEEGVGSACSIRANPGRPFGPAGEARASGAATSPLVLAMQKARAPGGSAGHASRRRLHRWAETKSSTNSRGFGQRRRAYAATEHLTARAVVLSRGSRWSLSRLD
jgi:hypothetical protein